MLNHGARRWGTGAGLAALGLSGLVALAGPASASTGEADVAVATSTGLDVAVQADGAPADAWTVERVASATVSLSTGTWAADWGTPSIFRQPGGALVMTAVRGFDKSLWFFRQAAGSVDWTTQEVSGANSANTVAQPSIAYQATLTAGQTTYTVIVAQNGDGQYGQVNGSTFFWQASGTGTWHQEALPSGTGVAAQPEISVAPDDTILAGYITLLDPGTADTPSSFGVDRMAPGGTAWTSEVTIQTAGTPLLQAASVIGQPNGNVVVSARDAADDTYFFWSPSGEDTTWYQESVGTGTGSVNPTGSHTTQVQPMALTGNDQGVAVGALSSTGGCDLAYDQANGTTPWVTQTVGCASYDTEPALAVVPASHNEAAAAVDDAGTAYFYWQPYESTDWNAELIPGISGVSANTGVSLAIY
jgi:hypothetical protein